MHKVQHLPLCASSVNQRFCQHYVEESIMGIAARTWKGSAVGRYSDIVQQVVLTMRLVALLMRLELGI